MPFPKADTQNGIRNFCGYRGRRQRPVERKAPARSKSNVPLSVFHGFVHKRKNKEAAAFEVHPKVRHFWRCISIQVAAKRRAVAGKHFGSVATALVNSIFIIFNKNYSFSYFSKAAPRARQSERTSSSGASWQMTLSAAKAAPRAAQLASQLCIHSPMPQP